ncbi:MAG: cytochrome c biogenesis protein ResB [Nitrospirae bacterium]|nr:cytochrome c biogenesis protein ResB [Nitrospirota bacterium]
MEGERNKTSVHKIWDLFASVKLAIVIFALISLTSIIGTVLEQRAEPAKNIQILTKLFGESLAPTMYNILEKLGFIDMYHAWWFVALLIILATNIIVCSLERLPKIWKVVKEPIQPMREEQLKKFAINREIVLKGKPDKVKDAVTGAIKGAGFNYTESKEEKGYQFYSQKGNYSRLGVYVTHFSILVILIGAIIGVFFGFNGHLNLPEGAMSNVAYSGREKVIPLGFDIRCDNFDVEFYGRSDMPKEYRSYLTVIKNGREVLKKSIAVNDPLTYEGITFYQASYGLIPENFGKGIFIFRVISRDGKISNLNLRFGDTFEILNTTISGKIIDLSPALKINEKGQVFTYANQMNNPAVYIDFSESGKHKYSGWLLKRYPETWQLPEGHRVEFIDYWGVEYTGLQVRKDPGVWVVYLGCITMSIGLYIAFFMSHRRLWVRIVEERNNTRVVIGATSNKNRAAFERKINKMLSLLSKRQEGGR